MKIRDLILAVLIIGMVISTGTLVVFAGTGISDIKDSTSQASSGELLTIATENLKGTASAIRNSMDSQMENQYEMVKTWAQEPSLVAVAYQAKGYSLSSLYDMWSDPVTRAYDDGEAVADGDPANDLDPTVSRYLARLVETTAFAEIFITDSRGYAIAASGATGDFDQGPDDWRVFMENGEPVYKKHKPSDGGEGWYKATNDSSNGFYVSDIVWDDSAVTWGLEIMSQLRNPVTNEYLGQIKAVFDYGTFIEGLVYVESLGYHEIKVVDSAGIIVATSMTDKTKVNNTDYKIGDESYYIAALNNTIPTSLDGVGLDEADLSVFAGAATSLDTNGHIVVVTKRASDVATPINAFIGGLQDNIADKGSSVNTIMIVVGIAVSLAIIIVAAVIMRRKVSVPLAQLTAVSDKLSRGEIEGLHIDIQGKDEISSFGESFKGVLAAFNFLKEEAEKKK